jgi:hypothetical protein
MLRIITFDDFAENTSIFLFSTDGNGIFFLPSSTNKKAGHRPGSFWRRERPSFFHDSTPVIPITDRLPCGQLARLRLRR